MYIKSIILDGFKSYGKRVEINGFDPQFNAITGLNGTGKSNILDSICFVLGITNLSHVRAGSLQELIYKNGSAGINKAVVTLVFDNRDADRSPPGYEAFQEITISRQVMIGGKNKYWVNGVTVQNKKITDIFCSVQLNVNNPHFLIMQGKVTKVLNMKSKEILAMIEEAAGTRTYEMKKQSTQKILEKKEAKLSELNNVINEEISPKLEKLRNERQLYYDYMKVERELTNMRNRYQAWICFASQRITQRAQEKYEEAASKKTEFENKIKSNEETIEKIIKELELLANKASKESDGVLSKIEEKLKEQESINAKMAAKLKSSKENVESEEKRIAKLQKTHQSDENLFEKKKANMSKVEKLFETLKENDLRDTQAFELAQKKFEALSAGMEITESGQAQTLQEQLINAQKLAAESSTGMKAATSELQHSKEALKKKEARLKGTSSGDYENSKRNFEKAKAEVAKTEARLSKLNFNENDHQQIKAKHSELDSKMRRFREKIENFEARRPHTKFDYHKPSPNFDPKSVYGVVCRQIKIKDQKYAMALETAAGSKLYNVIVKDETVGKELLSKGRLQNRTIFIPLNKIIGNKLDARVVRKAQNLVGAENAIPALDLVEYRPELQKAMEFVFGNVFICTNLDAANEVTFNPEIRKRCVTLDGDETDPGGVLSGGALPSGTPTLLQLQDIQQMEMESGQLQKELVRLGGDLQKQTEVESQYKTIMQELEMKQHELAMAEDLLKCNTYHQDMAEVEALKQNIESLMNKVEECKKTEKECAAKIKEIEKNLEDSGGHIEKKLKEAEKEMKKCKEQAEKSRKEWDKRRDEYERLNMEITELATCLENMASQIKTDTEKMNELKEQIAEMEQAYEEHSAILVTLQEEFSMEKRNIAAKNKEMQSKSDKKEQLQAQIGEIKLSIQKQEHELNKLRGDFENAKAKQTECAKKAKKLDAHIMKEAEALSDQDGVELQHRIAKAEETKTKLGRGVNANAQGMFEQEEKQYGSLLKKKKQVEKDKRNLVATLEELDKKKQDALKTAYEQVKKDFGSIFSTLLPGANATLQPPKGKSILDGLDIKVSLSGVWKENLTELSGGQRSLAALALILAMLLFKPAPIYILDEVDAALDLSHTQNIGLMLKNHFKQSQFIVVSLKDGMFTNANVLFRTQLMDGVSSVSRTANKAQR